MISKSALKPQTEFFFKILCANRSGSILKYRATFNLLAQKLLSEKNSQALCESIFTTGTSARGKNRKFTLDNQLY